MPAETHQRPGLAALGDEQARRLLRTHELGRLAVRSESGVDVFPVNYLMHGNAFYFRTTPGSKLESIDRHPEVAFEIDGGWGRHVWSVVVHGDAARVLADDEAVRSGIAWFRPRLQGDRFEFVRISPRSISGRRSVVVPRVWTTGSILIAGLLVAVAVAVTALVAELWR